MDKTMIIGLIGQKRVGKDTVANLIKELDPEYRTMALADPIKDIARIMFNFTEAQLFDAEKDHLDQLWNIKPREFFEQFGTEIMQFDIYKYLPNLETRVPQRKFWVYSLLTKIKPGDKVIITDVRGSHELEEIIKKYPNAKFIKITRPSINGSCTTPIQHITQLEPYQISDEYITHSIVNDGTLDELRCKVCEIMKQFV
jgi:hypothetical protein